jgi:hypothetical protein
MGGALVRGPLGLGWWARHCGGWMVLVRSGKGTSGIGFLGWGWWVAVALRVLESALLACRLFRSRCSG